MGSCAILEAQEIQVKLSPAKNHGKKCWRVNYSILGVQRRKFKKTKAEAQAWVKEQEKKLWDEGPSLAAMTGVEKGEMITFWNKLKELKVTPHQALEAALADRKVSPLVSKVVEECLLAKRAANRRERYLGQLGYSLNWFAKTFAASTIASITPADIESCLQVKKWSPRTRKGKFIDIRTLFSFATKRRYRADNPCHQIEIPTASRKTPGILRVKACEKLMRVAYNHDRNLCPWLALALFCGIRPEEASGLTWKNIIPEKKLVHIPAEIAKTRNPRNVVIPDNALEWLKLGGDLSTVRRYGKKSGLMSPKNLKWRFGKVRRQAGLYKGWPHDAMRHSSVTYLYALTEDAAYVTKQHGHGVGVMMVHYNATRTSDGQIVNKEMAERFYNIRPQPMLRVLEDVA